MQGSRPTRRSFLPAALVALALLAGCGGGGDDDDTTTNSTSTTDTTSTTVSDPPTGGPLEAPAAEESIEDAADNLTAAVKSGDCKEINSFVPTARSDTQATKVQCKAVESRLDGAEVDGTEEYEGAGVIDFTRGARTTTALMVVDRTGRFKLAQLNGFLGELSAGTKPAKEFDEAAEQVVKTMKKNDCEGFREVASYHLGAGSARRDDKLVCEYVKNGPIAQLLKQEPNPKPESLGGNSQYAFYGLATESVFMTMVMTRQSNENLPEAIEQLPDGAAEYVFLDVIPTNSAPVEEE